jgi:opacity protein-like surface antigen
MVVLALVLAVFPLTFAQPAAAQDYAGEWAIGYSFLGNNDLAINSSNLPLGWYGAGAYNLSENLSIAFDLSGNYNFGVDVCGGIESIAIGTLSQPAECLVGVTPATADDEFQGFSNQRAEAQWCSPTLSECDVNTVSVGGVAGPRFQMQAGNIKPFVHFMGGVVRSVRKISFFSHTATNLAIQPGGGVDVDVNDAMAVRFQGDYRMVIFPDPADSNSSLRSDDNYNEFRFAVGVVFKVGER